MQNDGPLLAKEGARDGAWFSAQLLEVESFG